jgi:hypothetical protein
MQLRALTSNLRFCISLNVQISHMHIYNISKGAPVFQPGSVRGLAEEGGERVVEPHAVLLRGLPARSRQVKIALHKE